MNTIDKQLGWCYCTKGGRNKCFVEPFREYYKGTKCMCQVYARGEQLGIVAGEQKGQGGLG